MRLPQLYAPKTTLTIETLTSEKNPLLKEVRRAASHGGLTDKGFALAEGFHLLDEALASGVEIGAVIAAESAREALATRYSRLEESRMVTVADRVFAGLTTTEQPQGVLALVKLRAWAMEDVLNGDALVVVLDGIQDPGNAGAMLRCAEAFGATGVVFLKGSVHAHNPKCLRGSAGSAFRVPVVAGIDDAGLAAAMDGVRVYATAPRAVRTLEQADFRGRCAVIIGGESKGVRESLASQAETVRIPTQRVESLNAAVACGVVLYEARRQRSQA